MTTVFRLRLRDILAYVFLALAICWLAPVPSARAQAADPDEVLATIGSTRITAAEVDRLLAGRSAFPGQPEEERRQRMLETLIAEYLIDYFYGQDLGLLSEQVLDSLADARRQVLFQLFAQSRFDPPSIAEDDVAAFVAGNPRLFLERRAYQYLDLRINGGTSEARAAALARVPGALAGGGAPLTTLTALVVSLSQDGLNATVNPVWATSEAIPPETLARLLPMAGDGRALDAWTTPDTARALVLVAADPAPLDPASLTPQIERRLLQQAFQSHRDEIITLMAKSVLETDVAAAADPRVVRAPPRGTVVWSPNPVLPREVRLAGFFGGALLALLAAYGLITWIALVYRQLPMLQKHELVVPTFRRSGPATTVVVILVLLALPSAGLAGWVAGSTYGVRTTLVLLGGAAVLALALALVWHARTRRYRASAQIEASETYSDPQMAYERGVLEEGSGWRLLATLALFVCAAICLAVLLDLPFGLR